MARRNEGETLMKAEAGNAPERPQDALVRRIEAQQKAEVHIRTLQGLQDITRDHADLAEELGLDPEKVKAALAKRLG